MARAEAQTGAVPVRGAPTDISTYRNLDDCWVAVGRAWLTAHGYTKSVYDAILAQGDDKWIPLPDTARAVATRCLESFHPQDSVVTAYPRDRMVRLWLATHREAESAAIIAATLAAATDSATQRDAEKFALAAYQWGNRQKEYQQLLEERVRRAPGPEERIIERDKLTRFTLDVLQDTAMVESYFRAILADAKLMEKDGYVKFHSYSTRAYSGGPIASAVFWFRHREIMDRLAQSTEAYYRIVDSIGSYSWGEKREFQMPPDTLHGGIVADFWFGRASGDTAPRPTKGKVSVVVAAECAWSDPLDCLDGYSFLREVGRRFPEVEITMLSRNNGMFGMTVQADAAKEAAWQWKWLHEWERLPGALAVSAAPPYIRLPEPDNRVLVQRDSVTPTGFGKAVSWDFGQHFKLAIYDRQGRYVGISSGVEQQFTKLIDFLAAVLKQPATGAQPGGAGSSSAPAHP